MSISRISRLLTTRPSKRSLRSLAPPAHESRFCKVTTPSPRSWISRDPEALPNYLSVIVSNPGSARGYWVIPSTVSSSNRAAWMCACFLSRDALHAGNTARETEDLHGVCGRCRQNLPDVAGGTGAQGEGHGRGGWLFRTAQPARHDRKGRGTGIHSQKDDRLSRYHV